MRDAVDKRAAPHASLEASIVGILDAPLDTPGDGEQRECLVIGGDVTKGFLEEKPINSTFLKVAHMVSAKQVIALRPPEVFINELEERFRLEIPKTEVSAPPGPGKAQVVDVQPLQAICHAKEGIDGSLAAGSTG